MNPDICKIIDLNEEAGSSIRRCPGYNDIPVFITIGQHRDYLEVGRQNDIWESPTASNFNYLGKKLEWRLQDDKPFAVIYRHHITAQPGIVPEGASHLAVTKIATETEDGCIVAFINGNIPNGNEIARHYADEKTASFKCGINWVIRR